MGGRRDIGAAPSQALRRKALRRKAVRRKAVLDLRQQVRLGGESRSGWPNLPLVIF
jgi:hypothetical protein